VARDCDRCGAIGLDQIGNTIELSPPTTTSGVWWPVCRAR